MAGTASTPAPLDKEKGVVVVPFEDDEDTEDGQVFKRRRTNKVVVSLSSSSHNAESLREHPPSATSPPHQLALGSGVESESMPTPALAPELPQPVQELLKGYLHRASPGGPSEGAKKESTTFYLGAFLACNTSWHDQTRAKASELSTLQALEKECASLKEEKETLACHWARQEETYKVSLKEAQKAKDAASKRLHEAGQAHAELLGQVVPLRVQIADLKDTVETSKAQQKKLEDQSVDREVKLGEVEAALNAKAEAFDRLKTGKDEALAAKDKELASQAEHFKETEKELTNDAANAFADGFAEALAQAACANLGIDTSCCGPLNHIVDDKVVP